MTNQTTYISIGTVRVRSDLSGGSTSTVIFTPNNDFCISHADGNYVALVEKYQKGRPVEKPQKGILVRCNRDKDLHLDFDGENAGTSENAENKKRIEAAVKPKHLLDAAIKQCAVEIEVEDKSNDSTNAKWCLRSITIPAASKTK